MATEIPSISWDTLLISQRDPHFLGRGAFSDVYRCYHRAHGDVAVKILKTCGRHPITSFNKEGRMHLKANSSPHILSLHGIAQHQGFICLVLEYMPYGDLAGILMNPEVEIPFTVRLRALYEAASAVAYLHNITEDRRFIHCDLKAENILLNSDLHVKIADFGGSTLSSYTGATMEMSTTGDRKLDKQLIQYTLSHAAPELLSQLDMKRTPAMDVYSFAIVMYVVSSRIQPFASHSKDVIAHAVKAGQRPKRGLEEVGEELEEKGDILSKNILDKFYFLMENCWQHDPKERLKMVKVRDDLWDELSKIPDNKIADDVINLKGQLKPPKRGGKPDDAVPVYQRLRHLERNPSVEVRRPNYSTTQFVSQTRMSNPPERNPPAPAPRNSQHQPTTQNQRLYTPASQVSRRPMQPVDEISGRISDIAITSAGPGPSVRPKTRPSGTKPIPVPVESGIRELEASFADPYLRQGNSVRMIRDIAAVKNAQIGHGGWNDTLMELRDVFGVVQRVEDSGDVTVSFSGAFSHRFNPCSLVKIPSESDLYIGDLVTVTLDKELVKLMQKDHGGWSDDMEHIIKQTGLIFRFLQEGDILAVYKSGLYFRFNPEVLCKASGPGDMEDLCLRDNPSIKIGDYVCHDMEEDVMRELQEWCGGWNKEMSSLKGKVGKLVYADYHGRAFVAYNSKCCYVFNPAAITKLSQNDAIRRFQNFKDEMKKQAKLKVENNMKHRLPKVNDLVRVQLPLDVMIEMQRGHGGWCYQMLEVYGLVGVVNSADGYNNAQVLYDTGNKWTFNPAALDITTRDNSAPPLYSPPFRIGDKVRVKIEDLDNRANEVRHVCKLLEIPEEKVDILTKMGTVAGMDDDLDVIVRFGEGKCFGIKPEQLEKVEQ